MFENLSDKVFFRELRLHKDPANEPFVLKRIDSIQYEAKFHPVAYFRDELHMIPSLDRFSRIAAESLVNSNLSFDFFKIFHLDEDDRFKDLSVKAAQDFIKYHPKIFFDEYFYKDSKYKEIALEAATYYAEIHPSFFMALNLDKVEEFNHLFLIVLKNLDKV